MNIFEQASRQKLRFASSKGELTVEQLWDLPLTSKTNFDLDSVAREVNKELKAVGEESFVASKANPAKARLELSMELVKHVISEKLKESEAAAKAQSNSAERRRLLEVLHSKENDELNKLSPDEIRQRIAALEG